MISTTANDSYVNKGPDAAGIGAAVEHLVAASCILASDAVLNGCVRSQTTRRSETRYALIDSL